MEISGRGDEEQQREQESLPIRGQIGEGMEGDRDSAGGRREVWAAVLR